MQIKRNIALLALCLSITASLSAANLKAMANALNGAYAGRVVILRRFSSGSHLHYAENGDFVSGGDVGPWTLDAYLQVTQIQMNRNRLRIDGNRLDFMYDNATKDLRPYRGPMVSIDIKIDPASTSLASVQKVLSRVFVSERAAMANLAPDYWRAYLLQTASYKKALASAQSASGTPKLPSALKITPPRPKHTPDPRYPREAREQGVHGSVILGVLIKSDGTVGRETILRPLGMGMDDAAVETVKRWSFIPAMRDGRPVAFQIVITVTFHLFR